MSGDCSGGLIGPGCRAVAGSVPSLAQQTTAPVQYSSGPCYGKPPPMPGCVKDVTPAANVAGVGGCNATAPTFQNALPSCQLSDQYCDDWTANDTAFTCNNDWAKGYWDSSQCGALQHKGQYWCWALDGNLSSSQVCPVLGSGGSSPAAPVAINWYQIEGQTNGLVQCEYDPAQLLADPANVQEWLTTFGTFAQGAWQPLQQPNVSPNPTQVGYNQLMNAYCQRVTSDCTDGVKSKNCSLVFQNTPQGGVNPCFQWYTSLVQQTRAGDTSSADILTDFIGEYCGATGNAGNSDCNCYYRAQNPLFQAIFEQASKDPPECWWVPCEDESAFLVTPDTQQQPGQSCAGICENVIIYAEGDPNITNSQINQYLTCGTGGGGNGPAPPASTPWALILGIGGAIVVIILVFLGILLA